MISNGWSEGVVAVVQVAEVLLVEAVVVVELVRVVVGLVLVVVHHQQHLLLRVHLSLSWQ
jgi:hypothetical protein